MLPRPLGTDHLASLPEEVQLRIADKTHPRDDRASLCLAMPRLGIRALRALPRYRDDKLLPLAIRLSTGQAAVNERLLRRYVNCHDVSNEGCEWLTSHSAPLAIRIVRFCCAQLHIVCWYLVSANGEMALLRMRRPDHPNAGVVHYEGEHGAERVTRVDYPLWRSGTL